jgi:hypothetical protein
MGFDVRKILEQTFFGGFLLFAVELDHSSSEARPELRPYGIDHSDGTISRTRYTGTQIGTTQQQRDFFKIGHKENLYTIGLFSNGSRTAKQCGYFNQKFRPE